MTITETVLILLYLGVLCFWSLNAKRVDRWIGEAKRRAKEVR